MSAFERVGEFGTMMALGNRGGQVFRLLVVENVLLGISGGLIGVAIGILLAFSVSAIGISMPPPPNANIGYTAYFSLRQVNPTALFVGVSATILASLLPAWRVGKIPVVEALRRNY